MPTISLTDNTGVILTASSADDNATLNRYLKSIVNFKAPPGFASISALLVKDQHELDFPLSFAATGEGKFAVAKTTLDIQLGANASAGLLQGADEAAFFAALNMTGDPASSGLVSFAVAATLTAEDSVPAGDFTFGITQGATCTLTSYYEAAAGDKLVDAVKAAIAALTIPRDITDLKSLPSGAICSLDANSSLKFSASFTCNFLNDPLATVPLGSLPSFNVNATASATIEGAVTHTSDHTLTIARLSDRLFHLSVSLTGTNDFETSLTVSAGATAQIGSQDALAFLLDKIDPNSAAEADAIASQMPDAAQFKADIKSAIDTALSASLAASLKASLDRSTSNNRMFVYEIDIDALDDQSTQALQAALTGDFTAFTATGAAFAGIGQLDSALTVTATRTHTMALHFLGIFNAASVNKFVSASTIDFTADTHELVLSGETVNVAVNNLDAEKLRRLVLKNMTLTLPASASTPDVKTPITLTFIDREGSTGPSKMRQFVNVLNDLGSPAAAAAQALLSQNPHSFGVCALSLGLSLIPAQCRSLFIGAEGPYGWPVYIAALSAAQMTILAGDPANAFRLRLFSAGQQTWNDLHEAGAAPNIKAILLSLGLNDAEATAGVADVITAVWWADAMAAYATALAKGKPLATVGKEVVKDSSNGYNEPWMILAAWGLTGKPPITADFVTSLPKPAVAATLTSQTAR
jgi:hypothetical protein